MHVSCDIQQLLRLETVKNMQKMYFLGCLYTLHVCKHLFWVSQVLLYVQKRERDREREKVTSNVYMIQLKLKTESLIFLMQNNDFKFK